MNQETKELVARIEALERAVESLRAAKQTPAQQITLPLDPASAQVLREEMIKAGFNYP